MEKKQRTKKGQPRTKNRYCANVPLVNKRTVDLSKQRMPFQDNRFLNLTYVIVTIYAV